MKIKHVIPTYNLAPSVSGMSMGNKEAGIENTAMASKICNLLFI